jgi:type IV pilus assembly protein PilN
MIKINLLPTKRKKKAKPIPPFVVAGVLLLLVSLVISGYGIYYMNSKIKNLQAQKAENAKKIEELNKKIAEVKDYERRNQIFMERKKIIEQLTANQSLPVKILDEMSKRLTDGVWLNSMKISRGSVSISGVGFSNNDIVTYVQSLKGSALFQNVILGGTSKTSMSGTDAYSFSISLQVPS